MCEIVTGYTKPTCRTIGGLKRIVVYNLGNRVSYAPNEDESVVNALTLAAGKYAYPFDLEQDLSGADENEVGSRAEGTFYVEQMIEIILNDNRKETRNIINSLGNSYALGIIGLDAQNVWRHYGIEGGLALESGTSSTGRVKGDRNGSTLSFTGTERLLAPEIAASIVNSLLAPAS
jgi:hypothetical protein